jgi:Zn-dependent alcohol dehydrogenase
VAVHGCGGVGLSAIMIANAIGANVVAIDISERALTLARALGAAATVDASQVTDVVDAVKEITRGGATSRSMRSAIRPPASTRSATCAGAASTCRSG